jgi:hypothetical protein
MSSATPDYHDILTSARALPPNERLSLAEELLRTLHSAVSPSPPRGLPADQVRGLAGGAAPPPDDDTVRSWIEEHRAAKYG